MAAADQRLEITFDMVVKNDKAIVKLQSDIRKLRAEFKQFSNAVNGAMGPMQKFPQVVGKNTNVLDANSKMLRRNRQAMQQAGIQAGDFFTQVSAGTSPFQAFNQQIGQLGYALSISEGRFKKFGQFLAGPWSVIILGASIVLQKLWEEFGNAEEPIKDVESALKAQKWATSDLEEITVLLNDANKDLSRTSLRVSKDLKAASQAKLLDAEASLRQLEVQKKLNQETTRGRVMAANPFLSAEQVDGLVNRGVTDDMAKLEAAIDSTQATINRYTFDIISATIGMSEKEKAIQRVKDEITDLNEQYIKSGKNFLKQLTITAQLKKKTQELAQLTERSATARRKLNKEDKESLRVLSQLDDIMKDTLGVSEAYEALMKWRNLLAEASRSELGVRWLNTFDHAIKRVTRRLERANDTLRTILEDGAKPLDLGWKPEDIEVLNIKVMDTKDMLTEMQQEMVKSFQTVGMAVANAFQGMLSGAQSWKDGMKGIIRAVIDELWRLYVVQQIVGLVVGALGGLTGTPTPKGGGGPGSIGGFRAMGGSVAANTPYIVGERGPEMFMPNQSGTIIPNHNMRGGGGTNMTVNVDARGSNDPAAVRAEVERGILEAAPVIVAASQKRTVETLRRPRLAGNAVR